MSAVRGDEPTGTTADKMCQSPKRDSWVTTVLVDEVMSEGDEDSMSCFSQPERVKSTDIQRIKILKLKVISYFEMTKDFGYFFEKRRNHGIGRGK